MPFRRSIAYTAVFAGLSVADSVTAQFAGGQDRNETAERLVSIRVASDTQTIAPGQEFHLAFVFDIRPQWHTYWQNPGASGAPTMITVDAPEGFEVGETRFTRPVAIGSWDDELGVTYGYEKHAVLLVPVTAPDQLSAGEADFAADIVYLVCKTKCLMGEARRTISVPTAARRSGPTEPEDPVVAEALRQLPRPFKQLDGGTIELRGSTLVITAPAGAMKEAAFFPLNTPGVTYGRPAVTVRGGVVTVEVEVEIRPQNALGQPLRIAGLLGLGAQRGDPSFDFELPLSDP